MASTTQESLSIVGNLSDNEDMASTHEDKLEGLTPTSSVASSPDATADKRKPILSSEPTPPRLGVELSELFTENVVAKIWRVAVRELEKQVHYHCFLQYKILTSSRTHQPTTQNTSLPPAPTQTTTPSAKQISGPVVSFPEVCMLCSSAA